MFHQRIFVTMCVVYVGLSLGACAYFEPQNTAGYPQPAGLTQDYAAYVSTQTQGGVEVFPLDGGAGGVPAAAPAGQPIANASRDDSVTVYNTDVNTPAVETANNAPSLATIGRDVVENGASESNSSILYFAHGDTKLAASQVADLKSRAKHYDAANSAMISVEGHSSVRAESPNPIGRDVTNLKVSLDRAYSVTRALIEGGVPAARVVTKGYGASVPATILGDKDQESANRRVEIYGLPTP